VEERRLVMDQEKGFDFSRGGRSCLSKALLSAVDSNLSGFQIYAKYFDPFTLVNANTNMSCLKRRSKMAYRVRATMYGRRPSKEPAMFSINTVGDVRKLGEMLESPIVIYYAQDDADLSRLDIWHDFRLRNATHGWLEYVQSEQYQKTISFIVTSKGRFYRMQTSACILDMCLNRPPFHLKENIWYHETDSYSLTHAISYVLNLPFVPANLNCVSFKELQQKASDLFAFWNCSILLVGYCKNSVTLCHGNRLKKRSNFSNCHYVTLAFIGENLAASTVVHSELNHLVALHADNRLGVVIEEHREGIIQHYKENYPEKSVGSGVDYQGIPVVTPDQAREALAKKEQKQREAKKKIKNRESGSDLPRPPVKDIVKLCKCAICSSTAYDGNMAKAGPERLCTVQLDVTDLLQMLGADTKENLEIVERLCQLSVASMDIESMTVTVHVDDPEPVLKYAAIDDVIMGGHVKKVQKPIMISHIDTLLFEECQEKQLLTGKTDFEIDLLTFTAESDCEEDIYKMMKQYWNSVLVCKQKICEEKKRIAQPILDLIAKYNHAHIQFFRYWQLSRSPKEDLKAVGDVWWQSIPGKLQKALAALIQQYEIFSFYG
jgi:hypothetical protein